MYPCRGGPETARPSLTIGSIERTVHKTNAWLDELAQIARLESPEQAYAALRATLHALRDRLTIDEATDLAAQLPMLIRGIYFEGWKPSEVPLKQRCKREFLEHLNAELRGPDGPVDAELAASSVFQLLQRKVTEGELRDVRGMLPEEIRDLWP